MVDYACATMLERIRGERERRETTGYEPFDIDGSAYRPPATMSERMFKRLRTIRAILRESPAIQSNNVLMSIGLDGGSAV